MDWRIICEYKISSTQHNLLNPNLSVCSYEIRLGEHRISTERDCRQQGRKEKCAPPVKDLGIEKFIIHDKYDSKRIINDIALLRLNESVTFDSE